MKNGSDLIKICFYLENERTKNVDCRYPINGNPGIGGTQYMIWLMSYYLHINFKKADIALLANAIELLPEDIQKVKVKNIKDAIDYASERKEIFVFRIDDNIDILEYIKIKKVKSVAWAHNYLDVDILDAVALNPYIVKYVCVSKEQLRSLVDHNLYKKATYINNAIQTSLYEPYKRKETFIDDNKKIVTYIGSLVPSKGFHVLAKIWPDISKKNRDAELYVIGSGNLYNRDERLGSYQIASDSYEKKFIKYLTDKDGKLLNNVKFLGVVGGEEKLKIMAKSSVGVVNPTAKTETFGIGAIEFEALNVPVVTKGKNGHIETVLSGKTGYLTTNIVSFKNKINELLREEETNIKLGKNGSFFVKSNFDIDIIANKWIELFISLKVDKAGTNFDEEMINSSNTKGLNKIRAYNSKLKEIRLFKVLWSVNHYIFFLKRMRRITKKNK